MGQLIEGAGVHGLKHVAIADCAKQQATTQCELQDGLAMRGRLAVALETHHQVALALSIKRQPRHSQRVLQGRGKGQAAGATSLSRCCGKGARLPRA